MFRQLWKFAFFACVFAGCAVFSNSQLPRDYVPIAGLVCSSPEMVDGDMDTSDLVYIEGTMGVGRKNKGINTLQLNSPVAHLITPTTVQLPKQSEVGMIIIYAKDLVDFNVLAKADEEWRELQRFRNNRRKRIVVTTPVVTNMIRVIAIKGYIGSKNPRPSIQEIQVYAKP